MTKRIVTLLLLLPALLITGCFDYQEVLNLNKDGSGTLEMRFGMQEEMITSMEAMAHAFGGEAEANEPEPFISKAHIEKYLAKHDAGVKLLSYEELTEEEMKVWKLKYSFEDLNSVYLITESLNEEFDSMDDLAGEMEDEEDAVEEDRPELTFAEQADGTWLFERGMDTGDQMPGMDPGMGMEEEDEWEVEEPTDPSDTPKDEPAAEVGSDDAEESEEGMDQMAEGMEQMMAAMDRFGVKLTVNFPGEVVESNATSFTGNSATWEFKLNEMADFPQMLRAVIK